jgi:hypothetical protein
VASDPAHRLYDSACELLLAAQRIRRTGHSQGTGEAIPATLGCVSAAVEELAVCTTGLADELRRTRPLSDCEGTAAMQALDRVTEQLLAAALECDRARATAVTDG